jgi:hypothetical protein
MIRFAAVLFRLKKELGAILYVAILAGILPYAVMLVVLGRMLGSSSQAK